MKKALPIVIPLMFTAFLSHAVLLIDDAETGLIANNLGGVWTWFSDASSSVSFTPAVKPGCAGSAFCRKLAWQLKPGAPVPFAGAQTPLKSDYSSLALGAFAGVRFYARGSGQCRVSLPIDATRAEYNHYGFDIPLTPQWKLHEIPFSSLKQTWGTPQGWNADTVYAVSFQALGSAGSSGELYLDDIEFYASAEAKNKAGVNPVIPAPKVNQVGYLPLSEKYFSIATEGAAAGDAFAVIDARSGQTVLSGKIPGPAIDDTAEAGEKVFRVSFSSLTAPGMYFVSINGLKSHSFRISEKAYAGLFRDALRCFYVIRCGTAVSDKATGVQHPACHLSIQRSDAPGQALKAAGGWHNAGDFGKWTIEAALSASYLMWLYELKTKSLQGLVVDIPESGNGVSDLLDEARWGLEWLMKMQQADGSVYHKIDTEPDFCFGTAPEKDPYQSYASFQSRTKPQTPSAIDAGAFTAVMAQAHRVFLKIDPSFAKDCQKAALLSWGWVQAHPAVGQTDPYYTDPDPSQEVRWAKAEIFCLTGDAGLEQQLLTEITSEPFAPPGWTNPQTLGWFSLFYNGKTSAALKKLIATKLKDYCDLLAATALLSGYGVATASTEYYWESNEALLHKAACLVFCHLITGSDQYRLLALHQLDYLLGTNSLDQCFVSGYGGRPNAQPYHWTMAAYQKLLPGWASGGPNGYPAGADPLLLALINSGRPQAKCWVDACGASGSWASNEGETSENAALVFLTGFFSGN